MDCKTIFSASIPKDLKMQRYRWPRECVLPPWYLRLSPPMGPLRLHPGWLGQRDAFEAAANKNEHVIKIRAHAHNQHALVSIAAQGAIKSPSMKDTICTPRSWTKKGLSGIFA